MALSDEEILRRYGEMTPYNAIEAMIGDMVDTSVIMDMVKKFGSGRYQSGYTMGCRDTDSRSRSRPGDGDMGG